MKKTFCDCCKKETKTYYFLELFGNEIPFAERRQYEICDECVTKLVDWIVESPVGTPL